MADIVALVHLGFIVFIVVGVVRGYRNFWLRLTLLLIGSGMLVQRASSNFCFLTLLEAYLRPESAVADGFVVYYLSRFGIAISGEGVDWLTAIFGIAALWRGRGMLSFAWRALLPKLHH
jgi:hypothetical protein